MMINTATRFSFLLAICFSFMWAQAGEHEPPGPPAPTMVTLQEISDKLDSLEARAGGVPRTGQTGCWNQSGISIPCAGTGQDGEYQAGVAVPDRFTDNGNGTVKDNLTGLTWLKNADCFGVRDWTTALSSANGLAHGACGLLDNSAAGDWRLPNFREVQSLIDFDQTFPALPQGHPFTGVQSNAYWSSTTLVYDTTRAWFVNLEEGGSGVNAGPKVNSIYVWPVRDGSAAPGGSGAGPG